MVEINPLKWGKQKRQETQSDLIREERDGTLIVNEAREEMTGTEPPVEMDLAAQLLDEDMLSPLFDPKSPLYKPQYEPLRPLFLRGNRTTHFDWQGLQHFLICIDNGITRAKNRCDTPEDFEQLENLRCYLYNIAYDSYKGFKVMSLTTREKRIAIREEQTPKPSGPFSAGR